MAFLITESIIYSGGFIIIDASRFKPVEQSHRSFHCLVSVRYGSFDDVEVALENALNSQALAPAGRARRR